MSIGLRPIRHAKAQSIALRAIRLRPPQNNRQPLHPLPFPALRQKSKRAGNPCGKSRLGNPKGLYYLKYCGFLRAQPLSRVWGRAPAGSGAEPRQGLGQSPGKTLSLGTSACPTISKRCFLYPESSGQATAPCDASLHLRSQMISISHQ